jgi:LysR family transcriptional regulator for metE and metH
VIQKYQNLYPNVAIEISNCRNIIEELKTNRFDWVMTSIPLDHQYIDYHPLFEDDIVLIASPEHPLGIKKFAIEKDLQNETLISMLDKSKDALYQYYLLPAGIKLRQFLTIDQPEAIVELVKSNLGLALFPKWSVTSQLHSGELSACRVGPGGVKMEWKAAYFKERQFTGFQQEFINLLIRLPLPGLR